ncbi:uncharacterized protein N0V89_009800 [Didymosphaeria variabile]|uniref:Uncharacterized protein n=1 Tax=Didymosphaeria variabile TaxID=1932322 RepID=A0A9W8XFS8_9PLEO|nr:uncharacterized protein N0V89_009800 [Didymosphaeria variabile]KAJ4348426.1 hypothetical protein N0V89_009800 [Didymosphaeria variabile]
MDSLLNLLSAGFDYLTSPGDNTPPQTSMFQPRQSRQKERDIAATVSYADICVSRALLKSLGLPTELVLEILDYAQYEPVLEFVSEGRRVVAEAVMGSATSARVCLPAEVFSRNTICRISGPNVVLKVKQIDFEIKSKDQGWTSENTIGTFQTSSWLEVSIFRPGPLYSALDKLPFWDREYDNPQELQNHLLPMGHRLVDERPVSASVGPQGDELPIAWYLQGNKVTERQNIDYRVVWTPDGWEGNQGTGNGERFFDVLKEGDSVLVWARAKYPQWRCEVDSIKMTVRYGFEEPS